MHTFAFRPEPTHPSLHTLAALAHAPTPAPSPTHTLTPPRPHRHTPAHANISPLAGQERWLRLYTQSPSTPSHVYPSLHTLAFTPVSTPAPLHPSPSPNLNPCAGEERWLRLYTRSPETDELQTVTRRMAHVQRAESSLTAYFPELVLYLYSNSDLNTLGRQSREDPPLLSIP